MGETAGRMKRYARELPSVSGGQQDPEEIRVDIEETRVEMTETIDAIEDRLSPERLKQEAKNAVREQTVGRAEHMVDSAQHKAEQAMSSAQHTAKSTGSGIMHTVKQNPMPFALIGVGLGWLVMERRGSSSQQHRHQQSQSTMGQAQHKASQYASEAEQRAEQVAGQAQHQAQHLAGQAQHLAGQAQHEVGHLTGQAQQQVQHARSQFDRMLHENPVAVGAVALGLGAAVGLAIPETRKEDQLMGEARDTMVHKAEQKVGDTVHQVQQKADDAIGTVQEVKKHVTG